MEILGREANREAISNLFSLDALMRDLPETSSFQHLKIGGCEASLSFCRVFVLEMVLHITL